MAGARAELEQDPCILKQSSVLLLIPWATDTGSCRAVGAPAEDPSAAPKSSLSTQIRLPSVAREITAGIQNVPGKAVALGSSWLILPFMAQTFQKSTFVEKIFLIALFATT